MAPGEIDTELIKKVLGEEKPITHRFADNLKPMFDITKYMLNDPFISDEDVISYILFPQIAEKFFKVRDEQNTIKAGYKVSCSKEMNTSDVLDMEKPYRGLNLINVDENTAALAIAMVCEHLKTPPEELHFKYIKALD
jgi:oxaloacetate decarboxylase alpha subunit